MYLWSKDGDGNLDDLNDTELYYRSYNATTGVWGAEARHTNDAVPDKNAKVVLDAAGGDAGLDPDHDGFTNRQEYLAGTNPHDANSYLKVGQFNVIQNGSGTGVISTISWAAVPGRLYAVQRSFDLQSWLTVADNIEPTPPPNPGNAAKP